MNDEKEPLRPRFKIQRKRISSDLRNDKTEGDFTPDKVIYIEIDDEITTVFDRIKRCRGEKIGLVVPRQAVMLQSVVNLKILKKKLDELNKEIVVVTTDIQGMQLAEKAGISVVERLFEKQTEFASEKKNVPLVGQRPIRITGEKVSISDVIRKTKVDFFGNVFGKIREKLKKKKQEARTHETRLVFIAPNKQALFTLILVSVLLLLTIAYIALPGATIYLTPKSSILDPSFNVTFLDYGRNREAIENNSFNTIVIPSFPVRPPEFTKKFTYNATGKIFKGENARGVITVVNLSNAPWDLAARTRFQTEDGLVFRTPTAVRVPAAIGSNPGNLEVQVVADEFDANGQVIGERGNIAPTRFFLPGLKNEENKRKLYGESHLPMVGGVTQTIKTVSQEDITASVEFAKKEATKGAVEDLRRFLEEENIAKKTNLSLLTDRNVVKISDPVVSVPTNLAGQSIENFEVTARFTASSIAFDRQELINVLKDRILTRADPDKKILRINEDDISYRFLDSDESMGKVRLTATMRAIQVYELDPEKENGARFVKKITDHILGMRLSDAITYLQQQTGEISNVEITTWPIWAPTIPNISDNIKFVIREDSVETN